jgi:dihydrofolate reductase
LISIIVAMTPDRVIGKDGQLPWRLPADMRHFRSVTMGHPVIMGRRTFDSIGKPLEGRLNIVLSRDTAFAPQGCTVVRSPDEAVRCAVGTSDMSIDPKEVLIIGGAAVYEVFLARAGRLYVTFVHADIAGDRHFPKLDFDAWHEVRSEPHRADERNPHDHRFVVYERGRGLA